MLQKIAQKIERSVANEEPCAFPRYGTFVLGALLIFAAPASGNAGATAADAMQEASKIIAEARDIVSPDGIERSEKVRIGGIEQWISIRGNDWRNPVLLFLHGGPGYVATPQSWYFGRGWEEYFTVVHWDQRASGRTHLLTDPEAVGPTLTPERSLADTEEIIAWTRKTLGKEKIFLVGHSAGSWLGLHMARRHPEWLHAYVGVGQVVNIREGERRSWQFAMDAAKKDGNATAMKELASIAPYPADGDALNVEDLFLQRKWVAHYGGTMAYRQGNSADSALVKLSPDYTSDERKRVWDGNQFSTPILLMPMLADDPVAQELEIPTFLFLGRHDRNVNSEVGAEWLDGLKAPQKATVWFEHSAHMPMTEEPGKFLISLVELLKPIALQAGDVADKK